MAKDECACVYLCLECISKVISYFLSKAEWSPDVQYGLQTETSRLELEIGWILLVASIGAFLNEKNDVLFLKETVFRVVVGFIGTLFFALFTSSGIRISTNTKF